MALTSFSKFYFGHTIDAANYYLDFDEGAGEINAKVSLSKYSFTELLTAIKTTLDANGTQTYTVTGDRFTRQITISSTGTFDLLCSSGTFLGLSAWVVLGFDISSDKTGLSSYTGENPSGKEYLPQFVLQDYKDKDMKQEYIDANVNESASGRIETVSFGLRKYVSFSLKFISDRDMGGNPFRSDPNGKANVVEFLSYLTTKGKFEFMEDQGNPLVFETLILEKLKGSPKGVGYELQELTSKSLPDVYEINNIQCRIAN